MERIPLRECPYLFDKVVQNAQKALGAKLEWLDYVFGLSERITRVIDGKKYTLPNIWTGGNDYMDLMPDQMKGNFCFFYLDEPVNWENGRSNAVLQLVVWYDTRDINRDLRDTERVKSQVVAALERVGGIEVTAIYDRPTSVYKGFTFDDSSAIALMHPFAGLRVTMNAYVETDCEPF